jgi:Kef-type K+ transport system membrane component KefB
MRRLGQTAVVGEIAVGILLGPSLLGWLWPRGQRAVLPGEVLPYLEVLGNFGLLVFMFLVGLELDLGLLRGRGRVVVAVSQANVLVPLGLGGCWPPGCTGPSRRRGWAGRSSCCSWRWR